MVALLASFYPKSENKTPYFKKSVNLNVCVCVGARENLSTKRPIFLDIFLQDFNFEAFWFQRNIRTFSIHNRHFSIPKGIHIHIARAIELFKIEKNSAGACFKKIPKTKTIFLQNSERLSEKEYFIWKQSYLLPILNL